MYQNSPEATEGAPIFIDYLYKHVTHPLLLIGMALFTIGSFANFLISINVISLLYFAMLILPLTGFWMLFAAAKAQGPPQKALLSIRACIASPFRRFFGLFSARTASSPPSKSSGFASSGFPCLAKKRSKNRRKRDAIQALRLFRVYGVISLIMSGVGAKIAYVITIAISVVSVTAGVNLFNAAITGPGKGMGEAIGAIVAFTLAFTVLIVLPLIAAATILYITLYVVPMLKALKDIENNVLFGCFNRPRSMVRFIVMSFIGISIFVLDIVSGFAILNTLFSLTHMVHDLILEISSMPALPHWILPQSGPYGMYGSLIEAYLAVAFGLTAATGMTLSIMALLRFNSDFTKKDAH
ncbi:MAG: hypothetical protein FWC76_01970 [Defluviitaleaceae bacterium]|nr:hypothetical protein [Defluviitaleaceae bacterium]